MGFTVVARRRGANAIIGVLVGGLPAVPVDVVVRVACGVW